MNINRDSENKIIGGVVAGIAEYFNFDLTAARIIAVILIVLFSPIMITLYFILWAVLKDEKHGTTIKNDINDIKEKVQDIDLRNKNINDIMNEYGVLIGAFIVIIALSIILKCTVKFIVKISADASIWSKFAMFISIIALIAGVIIILWYKKRND